MIAEIAEARKLARHLIVSEIRKHPSLRMWEVPAYMLEDAVDSLLSKLPDIMERYGEPI